MNSLSSSRQVSVSVTQTLLQAAASVGIENTEALLQQAGIESSLLLQPENRIPFEQQAQLWHLVIEAVNDETFPLTFGRHSQPASFSMAGYIAINSQTIGEAMDAFQTYQIAAGQGGELSIERNGENIDACYHPVDPGYTSTAMRSCAMLAANLTLGRWLVGETYTPSYVGLTMSEPANIEAFNEFFQCPVNFAQPRDLLRFPVAIADTPIPHASLELLNLMIERAEKVIADSAGKETLAAQVARLLINSLMGQEPDKSFIAEQLGISQRTLQRRLAKENSSYQEVLDRTRHQLALDYLQQMQLTISDIAYLLGFTEPSAFYRAFKKWHGMTPGQYRENR